MNSELLIQNQIAITFILGSICNYNRSRKENIDIVDFFIGYLIAFFWPLIILAAFYECNFKGGKR